MPAEVEQRDNGYPCAACRMQMDKPTGVWRLITCDLCQKRFHLANPCPTNDQRTGKKVWKCQECRFQYVQCVKQIKIEIHDENH